MVVQWKFMDHSDEKIVWAFWARLSKMLQKEPWQLFFCFRTQPGTRIASIGRPLVTNASRSGLHLIRQAQSLVPEILGFVELLLLLLLLELLLLLLFRLPRPLPLPYHYHYDYSFTQLCLCSSHFLLSFSDLLNNQLSFAGSLSDCWFGQYVQSQEIR